MPAEAAPFRRRFTRLDFATAALFALLSAQYFAAAVSLAHTAPWWMDEVLAVWTARLEHPALIWGALVRGAEFNPPAYDTMLGVLHRLGVSGTLGLRLPSIVAGYAAALLVGALTWRRAGLAPAAVAAGAVLASGLFGYAVQARPYALVTAVFAAALLCHDAGGGPLSKRRALLLTLLLTLLVALHFYALLLVAALVAVELAQARVAQRRVDRRVLVAAAIGGASILLWWPILAAARAYSGADVTAENYYARPSVAALLESYATVFSAAALPLLALVLVAMLRRVQAAPVALTLRAGVLLAVPLLVFAFALLVSHSYAERYVLAGTLGVGLLCAVQLARLGARAAMAAPLVLAALLISGFVRDTGELGKRDRIAALAVAARAPGDLPIATGSGLRYLEIAANAPPAITRRLVFLDVPGHDAGDPTNRNQVRRWKAIDPSLPVVGAPDFLCRTPAFLLFAQPDGGGADPLPGWLAGTASLRPLVRGGTTLTLVRSPPCLR